MIIDWNYSENAEWKNSDCENYNYWSHDLTDSFTACFHEAYLAGSEASRAAIFCNFHVERFALAQLALDGTVTHKDEGKWYNIGDQGHCDAIDVNKLVVRPLCYTVNSV